MEYQIPLVADTAEGGVSGEEELINVFPQLSKGGKYRFTLKGTPGLAYFTSLPTFPILSLHESNGQAVAVTPTKIYEIFADGSYNELGDVDLSGRVVAASNGIQVVFVDGKKGYYVTIATGVVTQLSGDGWYPSSHVAYQDGYFIFNRTGTGQFFISDLLSIDFDPLNFATAEGSPDDLVSLISDHRQLFLFGERSTEIWYNSGASDFTFERNQGAFIEKGCAAPYSVAKMNNTVYFVGSDLTVYQLVGYAPQRISTHAVEQTLKGVDLSNAFAYTYQDEGHLFYMLTIPNQNLTWCFDAMTRSWHKREDYHFGRHRSNNAILFNAKTLVGDFQNGRIYQMASNHYLDDGSPIVREFTLPTVNKLREFISIHSFELDMSAGVGLISGQGSDPQALLTVSKDGGKTWSNDKFADIGKLGEYLTRIKWRRLGRSRQFIFKINISDPVPLDIGGAYIGASE